MIAWEENKFTQTSQLHLNSQFEMMFDPKMYPNVFLPFFNELQKSSLYFYSGNFSSKFKLKKNSNKFA